MKDDGFLIEDHVSQTLFCDTREDGCHIVLVLTYKYLKNPSYRESSGFKGDWTCYIGAFPTSWGTEAVIKRTLQEGQKVPRELASMFFGSRIEYIEKEFNIKFRP